MPGLRGSHLIRDPPRPYSTVPLNGWRAWAVSRGSGRLSTLPLSGAPFDRAPRPIRKSGVQVSCCTVFPPACSPIAAAGSEGSAATPWAAVTSFVCLPVRPCRLDAGSGEILALEQQRLTRHLDRHDVGLCRPLAAWKCQFGLTSFGSRSFSEMSAENSRATSKTCSLGMIRISPLFVRARATYPIEA